MRMRSRLGPERSASEATCRFRKVLQGQFIAKLENILFITSSLVHHNISEEWATSHLVMVPLRGGQEVAAQAQLLLNTGGTEADGHYYILVFYLVLVSAMLRHLVNPEGGAAARGAVRERMITSRRQGRGRTVQEHIKI